MGNGLSIEQDSFLLMRLSEGNKTAFDSLFKKYYGPLCSYAYRFVELEDAEEIVQDVLLWLWENKENLNIQISLSSYLFKSVYHRSITCIEQKNAKQRIETLFWENQNEEIPNNIDSFQVEELIKKIKEAIDELPESYRKAFVMHRFKDMSYKEIAIALNVSPKTVDYRIQQSLKILRESLKDYFPLFLLLCYPSNMI